MEKITKSFLDDLTYEVNGAAIAVHKALGPGLLESIYHQCLSIELRTKRLNFVSELIVLIHYNDQTIESKLRCDFYIEDCLVLELKTHDQILPIHEAQLMTYMKLLKSPKGIIFNFNVVNLFYDGQKTFVNQYFTALPD